MPQIVLDGSGKPKSDLVEGAYELCGLNGFEFDLTPEEMVTGLRSLNDLMAELEADGISLGYDFPTYGNGLLEEPSGIPDSAVGAVKKLLAQTLCPALGATFSADARASLSRSWFSLRSRLAATPPSMTPTTLMRTNVSRRRRGGCLSFGMGSSETVVTPLPTVTPPSSPTLGTLTLSNNSVAENLALAGVVGTIVGTTAGSTLALTVDAGGRFAIVGGNLVRGATALDYETATDLGGGQRGYTITGTETLAGAVGSPKSFAFTIYVTNVFEQPSLGTLSFSSAAFFSGTPASGTIIGATAGSTIAVAAGTSLPTGLTINGAARTWAWDGTGPVSSGSFGLTETLADSSNSPVTSTVSYSISLPSTISAFTLAFPAGYVAGSAITALDISGLVLSGSGPVAAGDLIELEYVNSTSPTLNGDGTYSTSGQTVKTYEHTFGEPEQASAEDGAGNLQIDLTGVGWLSPSGVGRLHGYIKRTDGITTVLSPMSNQLSYNISASVAKWDKTTATNHGSGTVFTNTDLTIQNPIDGGFKALTRATIPTSQTKGQFELTVQTGTAGHNGGIYFGLDDGTVSYSSPPAFAPGGVDNKGFTINLGIGSTTFETYTNSQAVHGTTAFGTAVASNDVFTVEWDRSGSAGAHIITIYRNGTQVRQHTNLTITTFTNAFAGSTSDDLLTANFGGQAYTHAKNTGFNDYG